MELFTNTWISFMKHCAWNSGGERKLRKSKSKHKSAHLCAPIFARVHELSMRGEEKKIEKKNETKILHERKRATKMK